MWFAGCLTKFVIDVVDAYVFDMKLAAECLSGVRFRHFGDFLRRADSDDVAAVHAAFWPQVDEIIGGLNHFKIVFHDDDGIASINEAVQDREQLIDIVKVQPCRWFVKEIECLSGAPFG